MTAPITRLNNDCLHLVLSCISLRDLLLLYCTGNGPLWHNILNCTTIIAATPYARPFERVQFHPIPIDPFPTLAGFRRLQTLLLPRISSCTSSLKLSPLVNLPPTLKTASFGFEKLNRPHAYHIFFDVDFSSITPQLSSLSIKGDGNTPCAFKLETRWIDLLPKSLCSLSLVACMSDPSDSLIYLLQPTLSTNNSQNSYVLPSLEALEVESPHCQAPTVPTMPSTLKLFRIVNLSSCEDRLAPMHEDLADMSGFCDFKIETNVVLPSDYLTNLPRPHRSLGFSDITISRRGVIMIPPLSKTLTTLALGSVPFFPGLPTGLESLTVTLYLESELASWMKQAKALKRLQTLTAWIDTPTLVSALPSTLTELHCSVVHDMQHVQELVYRGLPRGLKHFEFHSVTLWDSCLSLLPPNLHYLHLFAAAYLHNGETFDFSRLASQKLISLTVQAPPRGKKWLIAECLELPKTLKYCQLSGIQVATANALLDEDTQSKRVSFLLDSIPSSCVCETTLYSGRVPVPSHLISKLVKSR